MNFENIKFPTVAVFTAAVVTPLIDYSATGGFSPITYVIEGICAVAVLCFVVVAFLNTGKDL